MRARTPCQNTAAPKTQTTSPTTPHFQRFSPKWSAIWAPHRLKSRPRRHQSGELHYTSLRHAARRLRVVQTPATAGVEGTGGAGGHGRLRDAGQAAAPVGGGRAWPGFEATHNRASTAGAEGAGRTRGLRCQATVPVGGGRAWPDNEPTHRAKLAARTSRGRADAHGRVKQHGPEQQREGRCTRYGAQHPLRGAAPDQKRCTAYGSGAAPRITRTNAESARREPGCDTRGRQRGLARLRGDAPSEARGADGSRAGRRPRARQAARPSAAAQPQLSRRSADTPRRTVAAIRDGNAGGGQPVA